MDLRYLKIGIVVDVTIACSKSQFIIVTASDNDHLFFTSFTVMS